MKIWKMNGDQESRSNHVVFGNLKETSDENREIRRGDGSSSSLQDEEVLSLHNSNHPEMTLVTTPLTRNNFLSWRKYVKIALGAKNKLSFIDGTYTPQSLNSPLYGG